MNDPLKIKLKSLWQGQVGIRDKYLAEVRKTYQGIVFQYDGKEMEIPYEKLQESIVGKSDRPFQDKYSREWHYLVYFIWKPREDLQGKLL
jgi:hypothetical protein